ncbi:MAG: DEAD/DEAH box helicase family protein [Bacteroidia bacterium]|nr:DEAD/DEAH box helicase family protein [Bacteroidia bacterium]
MSQGAKYKIGDRVTPLLAGNGSGTVSSFLQHGGTVFYEVQLDNGTLSTFEEESLSQEILYKTPWEMLSAGNFGSYRDFGIATTMSKIQNRANNTVSSLRASRTTFQPFQFKPLVKYLRSDINRILIADEVGLGKTIEAGHILLEMRSRDRLKTGLVVCSKSLKPKWEIELREKFDFNFKNYNGKKEFINDITHSARSGNKNICGIITYDSIKHEDVLKCLEEHNYQFDVLICDEAHLLRNRGSKRYEGFESLMKFVDSALFLTATPINNRLEDLYNELSLLDPDRYFRFEIFQNDIEVNKPFIRAVRALSNGDSGPSIADQIENHEATRLFTINEVEYPETFLIKDEFEDDPLFQRVIQNLRSGNLNHETKAQIVSDLADLNSLNHIFTRTRKRDVLDKKVVRNPVKITVQLTHEEQDRYEELQEMANAQYKGQATAFALLSRQRQLSSSMGAYQSADLLGKGQYDFTIKDSKWEAFSGIIQKVVIGNGEKIIVFAFFKNTLKYLKIRLNELGIGTEIIHGGVDDRFEAIERFRTNPKTMVLLSSSIGSEGLDLQFCHVIVNYDLPWNPMIVEQRIGRVDRIGQKKDLVMIYSLILKGTIEDRIYDRLLAKINVFQESLGDLEEILSEDGSLFSEISDLETILYTQNLTSEQANLRIDQAAQAFENKKLELNRISEELRNSVTTDQFVTDEIDRIIKNKRYLTQEELINFVKSIFGNHLSTCRLEKINGDLYQIELPNKNLIVLQKFIQDHISGDHELEILFHSFIKKNQGKSEIRVTFDQEYAFENPNIEFINCYHPLIIAINNFYLNHKLHRNNAFVISCRKELFNAEHEETPINEGYFLLANYAINIERLGIKGMVLSEIIYPVLIDLNSTEPLVCDENLAAAVLGFCSVNPSEGVTPGPLESDTVQQIKGPIMAKIVSKRKEIINEENLKASSRNIRTVREMEKYYRNRIKRIESLLADGMGIEVLLETERIKLHDELQNRMSKLLDSNVSCKDSLISVNILEVKG